MKILFLCSGNATRSIIAQAIANFHGGADVQAFSAGTKPSEIKPEVLALLQHKGIKTDSLYSKHLDTYQGEHFDVVVTLCDEVRAECEHQLQGQHILPWEIASPSARHSANALQQTLFEINEQVTALLDQKKIRPDEISPLLFYKCLADDIRLKTLAMLNVEGELCVCELMIALEQESQPKVSRHLSQLKKAGILCDRKYKKWVFYSINPTLPEWMQAVINTTVLHQPNYIALELKRLSSMGERPSQAAACCE
ncbi:metalloregulator ArsR/SmtB family transcription factor [Pseudoalteromonas sp. SCSIO 43201]|uniref:metalloregulator ArsR/SmtB family transcription factor n=1 Tax=Pseudoalteromonas TaxID=53246 RepID=UPI002075C0EB|nr:MULTISPECIES: metalloregulator ArsR/SmtB family transcription factor [Pseudoalteromonas]MDW7548469.1 metalloregulator ArsR/SmtB family transcription factor [Pseudoalteromonas peptidolytica]USD30781.1 metalloregulator ArsR/SmtB family transcription factor [Pseudoalteromonas sp. SCSIO 43201]